MHNFKILKKTNYLLLFVCLFSGILNAANNYGNQEYGYGYPQSLYGNNNENNIKVTKKITSYNYYFDDYYSNNSNFDLSVGVMSTFDVTGTIQGTNTLDSKFDLSDVFKDDYTQENMFFATSLNANNIYFLLPNLQLNYYDYKLSAKTSDDINISGLSFGDDITFDYDLTYLDAIASYAWNIQDMLILSFGAGKTIINGDIGIYDASTKYSSSFVFTTDLMMYYKAHFIIAEDFQAQLEYKSDTKIKDLLFDSGTNYDAQLSFIYRNETYSTHFGVSRRNTQLVSLNDFDTMDISSTSAFVNFMLHL